MKNTLYLNWKSNPSQGEVFTPIELVRMILNKIPNEVWTNPTTTFIDPCMGKGVFLIEIVRRLVDIYGYSEEDAKSRVFGYDVRVKYVNYLKRRGYKNVFHKDSLVEKFNMEFDVVLGNPPYQKKVGPNKTEAIWPKFVQKSFEMCKKGGYVSLIHPSGWRNVDGKFKETQKLLLSKDIKYLEIHNEKDGLKLFGAETRYDWYVVKNVDNSGLTKIKGQKGDTIKINLINREFIPNDNIDNIYSLLPQNNEETVEIISDSSYHTQRSFMSKTQNELFTYPCVYTVKSADEETLWFSDKNNNGHFDIPKLIWSNGRIISVGSVIDTNGDYGLTQFAYAIVDTPENLPLIKKVFDSKIFRNLMEDCAVSDMSINRKIIATFRKDFWKEFLDEDGNIIEPNFNQNAEQL
jgi:hypothetical protein